ncbi:unnamed protein product [Nyctereutes procyonoides]|uniref:(raccoon dog) hypothetical protein n=1 Tax=Nyctereutes procyonoides TaxID=34880 RepID=A0A811Z353_NYCPR|nr:unnamed protein product [Nyctereutes procyonoides]
MCYSKPFFSFTKKPNIWCRNPGGDRAPATARRLSPPPSDWDSALFLCWGHWTPWGKCSLVSDPPPGRPVLIAAASGQTLRHLVAPRFRGVKETSSLHGNHFCKQQLNSRWRGRPPPSLELIREGAMGTSQSKFDSKTPLGCLLANLRTLELDQDLRRRRLIHYCTAPCKGPTPVSSSLPTRSPTTCVPDSSIPSPAVPLLRAPEPQPPSSPLPSPPISVRTRSKNSSPDGVCPLREVAGAEGVVRVHAPFSLQDLSQIEKRLGSFSANPDNYIQEFQYLAQAYELTWHDLHVIRTTTLTAEERGRIQAAAREHADQVHLTDATMPVGAQAVPATEPGRSYQDGQDGRRRRDHTVRCLIAGLRAASNKAVNYDKIRDIIQAPDENPAPFLNRLTEALIQHTRLGPACPAGATVLATHFISQSAPDIRKKLRKVEEGPQTPVSDLVRMAFKVFNSREEAAELKRQARLQQKVRLQTQALAAALRPAGSRSQQKGGTNRTPRGPLQMRG